MPIRRAEGRRLLWVLRALWLTLPVTAGPSLAAALDPVASPVRLVASIELWAGWAVAVVAVLLPRPWSLAVVRVVAPAAAVAALTAAASGRPDAVTAAVAVAASAVAGALALAPAVGERFADGASYGDERRFLLRASAALLLLPIPLAWAVTVAGIALGPLLLADGRWVAGGVAVAAGIPLAALLGRALHQLTRRWIVLVPAGLVVHDHLALTDPVLLPRDRIARFGPAPATATDALDLTQGAAGMVLLIELTDEATLVLARRGSAGERTEAERLLVSPTRPGAVLAAARAHRIAT